MRLLIKICFYISLTIDCHAQIYTDQLDSIHKVLSSTSNDTIRMDMFARLGFYFDDVNLDSAVYYGEKGAAIASRLRLELNEAQIITSMCWPLGKQGNYPRALKLLN